MRLGLFAFCLLEMSSLCPLPFGFSLVVCCGEFFVFSLIKLLHCLSLVNSLFNLV